MDNHELMKLLVDATGSSEVLRNPQIKLFDTQMLDSMRLVELFLAIEERFGITISPAEFDRDAWATPELFLRDMEERASAVP